MTVTKEDYITRLKNMLRSCDYTGLSVSCCCPMSTDRLYYFHGSPKFIREYAIDNYTSIIPECLVCNEVMGIIRDSGLPSCPCGAFGRDNAKEIAIYIAKAA